MLRFVLVVMLGASFVTFVGAVLARFEGDQLFVRERGRIEAELRAEQSRLAMRMSALEDERRVDLKAIEDRLKNFGAGAPAADGLKGVQSAKTPFVIADRVGAIVELVCIDNVDKDVYYTGSGAVVTREGLIVTNKHLIMSDDGTPIKYCGVGFTSALQDPPVIDFIATSVAAHSGTDLAILRITDRIHDQPLPREFVFLDLLGSARAASGLGLGDPIFIAGYPGIGAETFTFTEGVVSGKVGPDLIKTSALIDTGTSGGAAFDDNGRYVGVPTAAARGDIGGSLGYLISAEVVEDFVKAYTDRK
ncbi:trypsin-like peptidase domain-containing protein [Candidatus Uhrbacteria bacterium]|nr:trypsin-like peptidase domain-containing protein [Candidatus Uhrbacteria bacterium]